MHSSIQSLKPFLPIVQKLLRKTWDWSLISGSAKIFFATTVKKSSFIKPISCQHDFDLYFLYFHDTTSKTFSNCFSANPELSRCEQENGKCYDRKSFFDRRHSCGHGKELNIKCGQRGLGVCCKRELWSWQEQTQSRYALNMTGTEIEPAAVDKFHVVGFLAEN